MQELGKSKIQNPKSKIPASADWIGPQETAALERLSREQLEAARIGDLETLGSLLDQRQRVLDGLRGRPVRAEMLAELRSRDALTREIVEAQLGRVEAALATLRQGARALHGYATGVMVHPGFIDQIR
jgi:hypothetical protein